MPPCWGMDRAKTAAAPLMLLGISTAVLCFHIYLAHGRPYRGLVALGYPDTTDYLPQQELHQQQRPKPGPKKQQQRQQPKRPAVQQKRPQPGKKPPPQINPKPSSSSSSSSSSAAAAAAAAAAAKRRGTGGAAAGAASSINTSGNRTWTPDRYIARYLYPRRKHGVFLQYGCLGADVYGNSVGVLASKRSWSGACLEPDPSKASEMSRKRPKELAAILHGALCGRHPVTGKYFTNFTRFGPPFSHWTGVWDAKHPWQQREVTHMVHLGDARVTGSTQKVPCTNPVQVMSKWGVFHGEEAHLQQKQKQQQQQQLRHKGRMQQQLVVVHAEEQVQLRGYIHLLALHIPPNWPTLAKQLSAAATLGLSIDAVSCSAACYADTASVSQTWVKSRASMLLSAVGYQLHVPEYYQKVQGHRARPVAAHLWVRKGSAVAARLEREEQHHLSDADLDLVGQIF